MACMSLLLLGFLVLATEVMCLDNISSDTEEGMEMEQEELLGFFDVMSSLLEDPTWAQMHPKPCTDTPWPGVECELGDQNPSIFHITKIHIGPDIINPPCKTSAKLSESLLELPYLKTLSLFNCFTTSPTSLSPLLFGSLSSLEHLALESNPSLSGELILPSLLDIPSLKVLCLSQNSLNGEIPKEIGGLVNLEQLDLSYNNFSGSVPEELGGMKSLTILNLCWNNLQGVLPFSLGQLQLLQKIDLSSNQIQGKVPSDLGNLKRLALLDLSHNSLNGPIPETLSGLQQLEYLIIEDNPINTGTPLFIRDLIKLKVLSLSRCGLTGPIPISFSNLKNLIALSLEHNSLIGTVPPSFGSLPNLDQLNLSQNQLSGELQLPQEFIDKLGKRLDVRGNNGLCLKQQLYKYKNSSNFLQMPSCLDTSTTIPSGNKTWAEQCPDSYKKKKPTWYQGDIISSNTPGLDQQFFFHIFAFLVLLFDS